jgi:hypothetical protein
MSPSGLGASVVRTLVPFLVSVVIGQAARIGLNLDAAATTEIVTAIVLFVYYPVSRWIETNVSTQAGRVLLSLGLVKSTPVYRPAATPDRLH